MKLSVNIFRLLAFVIVCTAMATSAFPQDTKSLSDRVSVEAGQVLVVNDLNVVHDDIKTMLKDTGHESLNSLIAPYFGDLQSTGVATKSGAFIFFGNGFGFSTELKISDRDKLSQTLGNQNIEDGQPIDLTDSKIPLARGANFDEGVVFGDRLIVNVDADSEFMKRIRNGKPLAPKLDSVARDIIDRSGMTAVAGEGQADIGTKRFEKLLNQERSDVTESETRWIKRFIEITKSPKAAVAGLKYHKQKTFEIRARAVFDQNSNDTLSELIDTPPSEPDWKPDLGLDAEQLIIAAAVKMDAFKSSAGPRSLQTMILDQFSLNRSTEFLNGNMIKLMMELVGDSWNELTAARIAMYENQDPIADGQIALVSIVDAKDPAVVIQELKRISSLTRPAVLDRRAASEMERMEEVARLIEQLESTDKNNASRAQTRLILAGEIAIRELSQVQSKLSDEAQRRAQFVVKRIKANQNQKFDKTDLATTASFWTSVNPGLSLKLNTGKLGKFPIHTIAVTPDPSQTPEQTAVATKIMSQLFGPKWNAIPVVEVNDHVVFMVGSNQKLLAKTVGNVEQKISKLKNSFDGVGHGKQTGQFQAFVNLDRLIRFQRPRFWFPRNNKAVPSSDVVSWAGLTFHEKAINIQILIPAQQIKAITH